MLPEKTETNALSAIVEKLDGGFISNISGKRRIYNSERDLSHAIDIESLLEDIDDGEYHLGIVLTSREDFDEALEASSEDSYSVVERSNASGLSILEQAKQDGIIKSSEKFDPLPAIPLDNHPIRVNTANCYSIDKLLSIDWQGYDSKIPLSTTEKANIAGVSQSSMHGLWTRIQDGTVKYQSPKSRIGMTVLAKYYERACEKKEKTEGVPPINTTRVLEILEELEALSANTKFVKASLVKTKINSLKKLIY